jgi:hypothetical protein
MCHITCILSYTSIDSLVVIRFVEITMPRLFSSDEIAWYVMGSFGCKLCRLLIWVLMPPLRTGRE